MKLAAPSTWTGATLLAMAVSTALASSPPSMADRLVVHEWGTFTVFQDERGNAIGGINTDDEPVPAFVHGINQTLIQRQSDLPPVYFKGVPQCDRSIYVRLETPVLYFHAPPGYSHAIDVDVAFRGGWLTQFYPDAAVRAPGMNGGNYEPGTLTDDTIGRLSWHDVTLGTPSAGPKTDDPVWLAPRRVEATNLTAQNGESERFIFYRGVGHMRTPVRVSRAADGSHLEIAADVSQAGPIPDAASEPAWLVDVRDDGTTAFRTIPQLASHTEVDSGFADDQYSADLTSLRRSIRDALIREGLYEDEADALLNTWEVSYFRRPGLRLFYMVPQEWTRRTLPLTIAESGAAAAVSGTVTPLHVDVRRAMVGRVELVTPRQRQRLAQIAAGPASNSQWLFDALRALGNGRADMYREEWFKRLLDGRGSLAALHVSVPADYRAYLQLGRFRNALILDEAARRPTPALEAFIKAYALRS